MPSVEGNRQQCNMWHSNSRQWLVTDNFNNRKAKTRRKKAVNTCSTILDNGRVINSQTHKHKSYNCYEEHDETWPPTMLRKNTNMLPQILYVGTTTTVTASAAAALVTRKRNERPKSQYATRTRTRAISKAKATATVNQLYQLFNQIIVVLLLAIYLDTGLVVMHSQAFAYELENVDDFDIANIWQRQQRLNSHIPQQQQHQHQNYKISPKPCTIGAIDGTCMFVWECIKSEGRHVGMCVDAFMFGSCCVHNYTDNIVMPQSFTYTRPTKPLYIGQQQYHKPRPPPFAPHRPPAVPSISGMTTIERPHGAGTLVIRPSGPHHQHGTFYKPHTTTTTRRTTIATTKIPSTINDMQTSASLNTYWNTFTGSTSPNKTPIKMPTTTTTAAEAETAGTAAATSLFMQQYWHMTTEPNFITKPRPPSFSWEKPLPLRPKPTKPTKSPATSSSLFVYATKRPTTTTTTTTKTTTKTKPTKITSIATSYVDPSQSTKPRPQLPQYTLKPSSTTMRPIMRPPTPAWITSESALSHEPSNSFSFSSTSFKPAINRTTTTIATSTSTVASPTTTTTTTTTSSTTTTTTIQPAFTAIASTSIISSTSVRPSATSTIATELPSKNFSNIEINEIADTSNSDGIIKLMSAARSECGIPTLARPETRIVGGKSSVFGHWPWQVSVRRTTFFGFSSTHRCGGALINENWISTAGHCVDDLLISQIRIRVGEYDFAHVQEQLQYIERGVVKKVVHPKYNFYTYEYDLALVKLESPLDFAPHVSPICLPQTESLLIGMNATVTGWGRLSEGGTLPSVLQEASVPIVSNDNCKSMFLRAGRLEIIPEIFLCAGYEVGGQDSCQGDSGGPLQVKAQDGRYFLAGIISWGIGCAEANLPGVCTRISKFVPWIMENVT